MRRETDIDLSPPSTIKSMTPFKPLRTKPWLPLAGLLGYLLYVALYPVTSPEATFHPSFGKEEALARAHSIARKFGFTPDTFVVNANLYQNSKVALERQLTKRASQTENEFHWFVEYLPKNRQSLMIRSGSANEQSVKDRMMAISISVDGTLLFFDAPVVDSLAGDSVAESSARARANSVVAEHFGGTVDSMLSITARTEQHRSDYSFTWKVRSASGTSCSLLVTTAGSRVAHYALEFPLKHAQTHTEFRTNGTYLELIALVIDVIIGIIIFVVFVRRLKNDEIGFRTALFWGIATFILLLFSYAMFFSDVTQMTSMWLYIFVVALSAFFRALVAFIAWLAGEVGGRSAWNEKFLTLDAIKKFKFRSRWIGESSLHGLLFAGVILGAVSLLHYFFGALTPTAIFVATGQNEMQGIVQLLESPLRNVASFVGQVVTYVTTSLVLSIFVVSLLRRLLQHRLFLIACGALLWTLTSSVLLYSTYPIYLTWMTAFVLGALVTWIFLESDAQAMIVAGLGALLVQYAAAAVRVGTPEFLFVAAGYGVAFGAIGISAFALSRIRRNEVDLDELTPFFVRRITERHRLQLEVESARHIQLSLLPRETPMLDRLQIAATCIPAHEVGGDYYDFISLDENRLGVLIGDVSGKGISAAFYMTLAKGVIASQARRSHSPRSVLISVNELLYEIMERGKFISMVYGIFDLDRKVLTYAHAGHNPLFFIDRDEHRVKVLRSRGMAIGLERGEKFSATLIEEEIPLRPEDAFLFYTDGYVEARNKTGDEFGEDRMIECIHRSAMKNADEILSAVNSCTMQFIGKTKQHDDMTIVVVKVAE